MGANRGFKSFVESANRGFKNVTSDALRGHKLVQGRSKSVANARDYVDMGSRLMGERGGETLQKAGEYLSNMSGSLHNSKSGELANRARQDFGNNSIMNA